MRVRSESICVEYFLYQTSIIYNNYRTYYFHSENRYTTEHIFILNETKINALRIKLPIDITIIMVRPSQFFSHSNQGTEPRLEEKKWSGFFLYNWYLHIITVIEYGEHDQNGGGEY